jgi:hypothetical protein
MENARLGTTYKQRKLFFKSNRNGTFTEMAAQISPTLMAPAVSRGMVTADLDNDGDLDVVINNLDGPPIIYRNDGGNRNNSILVRLVGKESNRDAFGTKLKVTSGDLVQVDECRSSGGYISGLDKRVHLGFEKRTQVDSIEVRWPLGKTNTYTNIPVNTVVTLTEGVSTPDIKPMKR